MSAQMKNFLIMCLIAMVAGIGSMVIADKALERWELSNQ